MNNKISLNLANFPHLKKTLLLSFLTITSFLAFSQTNPYTNKSTRGNVNTLDSAVGPITSGAGIVVTKYTDTTSANSAQLKFKTYPGAFIYTTTGGAKLWVRNTTGTQWVEVGSGSGVTVSSYGKNTGGDSTILLLSNGIRYAARDSIGSGGLTDTTVAKFPLYVKSTVGQKDSIGVYGVDSSFQNAVVVNDTTLRLYRFNGDSVSIPITTNGQFLRLGGTAVSGGVMTGDVRVQDDLFWRLANNQQEIVFNDDGSGVQIFANGGGEQGILGVTSNAVTVSSSDPTSKGITGVTYFSNKGPNTFSQMKDIADSMDKVRADSLVLATAINGKQNLVTLTTTGTSGAATFNQGTGALNIPNYAGGGITKYSTNEYGILIDSATTDVYKIRADTTTSGGLVSKTRADNIYLKKVDTTTISNRINLKQNLITLTTTGNSGASTFNQSTGALNIPAYAVTGVSGTLANNRGVLFNNGNAVKDTVTFVYQNGSLAIGGTPSAAAALDIASTTKGLLPPRMTSLQRNAISSPPAGLMVFDTNFGQYLYYNSGNWLFFSGDWLPLTNGIYYNGGVAAGNFSGSTTASAILEGKSTTRGFLPPQMTTAQKSAISSPANGLQVYDTDLKTLSIYNGAVWGKNQLNVTSGTAQTSGIATLTAGIETVNTTAALTASNIQLTVKTPGGTQGFLSYTITNGTSFTINSTSATETSTVGWVIIN